MYFLLCLFNFNSFPSLRRSHVSGYFKKRLQRHTLEHFYSNIKLSGLVLSTVLMKQDGSGHGASVLVV